MRAEAESVLKLLFMTSTSGLINKVTSDRNFYIFETATNSIFKINSFKSANNYIVSEYFENAPLGSYVQGIRNENLERLTFRDNSIDIVINSDVLEHVNDLNKALSEIKRVLKPGGFHIFTLPVDHDLPKTVERARIIAGKLEYLMAPVMHGDPIRQDGILAFRDFGSDVLNYMSREGFASNEIKFYKRNIHITSVYYAQKTSTK